LFTTKLLLNMIKKEINHMESNTLKGSLIRLEYSGKLSPKSSFRRLVQSLVFAFGILLFSGQYAKAQNETFSSGSYIINMGLHANVKATDVQRQLKPYGMIYELIKDYNVPVRWVIGQSKLKDGIDFTYNGVDYRGGTFIIPKQYITAAVAARIIHWNGQGVQGTYSISSLTVPVYLTLKAVPSWTFDLQNGSIATGFFANAGIPVSTDSDDWLLPSQLGPCNDIFVMPHADPKWTTHSNLYHWNQTFKGAIWAGCHAVSALENMYNPGNTSQQTNFLTQKVTTTGTGIILPVANSTNYAQNSLILWGNHSDGSIPYTFNPAYATDPVAQWMGKTDLAHLNGSEQIYLPVIGGGWLSSTKVLVYDPTPQNLSNTYADKAAIIAYGRAFGNPNNGLVMYEAGHSINKGTIGDVPAQRAFFNWSFLAVQDKIPVITGVTGIPVDGKFKSNPAPQLYPLTASFSSPVSSGFLSITWSAKRADNGADAGTFSVNGSLAAANTFFTPNVVSEDVDVIITVKVVDVCGRTSFESYPVTIVPGPRPPAANPDVISIEGDCIEQGAVYSINVLDNDTDPDGDLLTLVSLGVARSVH
jgi:hypothetical protein